MAVKWALAPNKLEACRQRPGKKHDDILAKLVIAKACNHTQKNREVRQGSC
jgi:hypothetical protein